MTSAGWQVDSKSSMALVCALIVSFSDEKKDLLSSIPFSLSVTAKGSLSTTMKYGFRISWMHSLAWIANIGSFHPHILVVKFFLRMLSLKLLMSWLLRSKKF